MQIQSIRIKTAYGVSWGYVAAYKAGKRKVVCCSTGQSFWI